MRYTSFMGTDDFLYSGECSEFSNNILRFMENISDNCSTGTFEIKEEIINDSPLYFAYVCFPNWAEALFLIQFYEYNWTLMEESE